MKAFLKQNSKLNLISKNDEKLLWEKHVFDSLAIEKFFDKYKFSLDEKEITLLDFGTGGGFPAVPISLAYPNIKVTAMDSIRKKINAISTIKDVLKILSDSSWNGNIFFSSPLFTLSHVAIVF